MVWYRQMPEILEIYTNYFRPPFQSHGQAVISIVVADGMAPSVNYFDTIFHITRPLILAVYVNIH